MGSQRTDDMKRQQIDDMKRQETDRREHLVAGMGLNIPLQKERGRQVKDTVRERDRGAQDAMTTAATDARDQHRYPDLHIETGNETDKPVATINIAPLTDDTHPRLRLHHTANTTPSDPLINLPNPLPTEKPAPPTATPPSVPHLHPQNPTP